MFMFPLLVTISYVFHEKNLGTIKIDEISDRNCPVTGDIINTNKWLMLTVVIIGSSCKNSWSCKILTLGTYKFSHKVRW